MLIAAFPAGPWQTNCYLVATGRGNDCVVIDPGMDAVAGVAEVVSEHHLRPVAVLLTHGHLDHMFSVIPICTSYTTTCWIHPDDRVLLADPLRAMSPDAMALLQQLGGPGVGFAEPDEVRELTDDATVSVAGLDFSVLHAPGHTPGSVMFRHGYPDDDTLDSLVFSGDVLFAGSVGRTDLPGGDVAAMQTSLRTKVLTLPDSTAVLPGHGPQTTVAAERARNPYLRAPFLPAAPTDLPRTSVRT